MQGKNLKATIKNSSFLKSRFLVYSSPVVNFMITFHHFDPSKLPIPLLHKYVHDVLGPVQTSNFTCAESNANEKNLLFSLICIRFGT